MVYGVEDATHTLVGTKFKPKQHLKGNQELENWLATQLNPKIDFNIYEFEFDNKNVSMFVIDATKNRPVAFRNIEFVRVGTYKKKLKDHPEKERKIWKKFPSYSFELTNATENLSESQVLDLIDYPSFFELTGLPVPGDRKK